MFSTFSATDSRLTDHAEGLVKVLEGTVDNAALSTSNCKTYSSVYDCIVRTSTWNLSTTDIFANQVCAINYCVFIS